MMALKITNFNAKMDAKPTSNVVAIVEAGTAVIQITQKNAAKTREPGDGASDAASCIAVRRVLQRISSKFESVTILTG